MEQAPDSRAELVLRWGSGIVRYPDPAVQVLDPRFTRYRRGNAAVERLYTGARRVEGPVWFGDGGSRDPAVHDESNLMTLRRSCHGRVHQGVWEIHRSEGGIRVLDRDTGGQVTRRQYNPELDVPGLFQLMNQAEDCLYQLREALPYLSDEELVEAFAYASSFGKRSWLLQAAVLYEAQQRSIYGDQSLEAIARRFEIGLRQAQKYALVWKVFFASRKVEQNVNFDAILLDEPSWYVVAATETGSPEAWLAYAQDRKAEDPRYSVSIFRKDIQQARLTRPAIDSQGVQLQRHPEVDLPRLERRVCPWIEPFCVCFGKPVPLDECQGCKFEKSKKCETKPNFVEA